MSTAAVRRGTLAAVTYATKGHIVMPKEPKGPKPGGKPVKDDHTAVVGVTATGEYYSFAGPGQLKRWKKSDLAVLPADQVPAGTVVAPLPEAFEFPKPSRR
jgi:hypothetical protein